MRKLLLTSLLIATIVCSVPAALLYTTDGDRVQHASNAVYDFNATGTACFWLYPTDDTQRQGIFNRSNVGNAYFEGNWRADLAGDNWEFDRQRTTTDLFVQAAAANFVHYGLNKWLCICFVYNTGGANADQKILIGDLDSEMAEPSAYATQTVGTGSLNTTYGTNDLIVGNTTNTAREFRGRMAISMFTTTQLTDQQMRAWQWNPKAIGSPALLGFYGFGGANSIDYSGNAINGTVTGATQTDHVPLGKLFAMHNTPRAWYHSAE